MFDAIDRKILDIIQKDADRPVAEIAEEVGLSSTPCWRRIKRLEDEKIIVRRVALLDAKKMNVPVMLIVHVRADHHDNTWKQKFSRFVSLAPEIINAAQITGDSTFILHVVVPDVESFRPIQQRLIDEFGCRSVVANIVLDTLKSTTAIPTTHIQAGSCALAK